MSKPLLYLGKADHGTPLSREEIGEAQYEEPWRYERVEGRLSVMPPSGHDHSVGGEPFRNHLGAYALAHPEIIEHVISEAWIAIDDDTDRIADIGVYLRAAAVADRIPSRVPEMVFEVVSEGSEDRRRDYEEKRADYLHAGVQEYVIVDPLRRLLTVLRRRGRGFRESTLGPDDVYTTPLLPGLEIPWQASFSRGLPQ